MLLLCTMYINYNAHAILPTALQGSLCRASSIIRIVSLKVLLSKTPDGHHGFRSVSLPLLPGGCGRRPHDLGLLPPEPRGFDHIREFVAAQVQTHRLSPGSPEARIAVGLLT